MNAFFGATAVLELGVGLALLAFPSETAALVFGVPLETPVALTVARVGGSGLIALGVASWFARVDAQSRTAGGLIAAMLFYNFAAVVVLAHAGLGLHLHGVALWPTAIIHAAMALWCGVSLRRVPKM
jgi:multisubunit Na+/H+ antiporter MnhG subunit